MKYGVIDVGSNSVRLMLSNGTEVFYKEVITTRLAEGMGSQAILQTEAVDRSAEAVSFFAKKAVKDGADKVMVFATAAVRRAVNSRVFTDKVKESCGLEVDVVSGEKEAFLGVKGALGNKDGVVIDVGGASTEITVVKSGEIVYSKSIYVGAVSLYDTVQNDLSKAEIVLNDKLNEFGDIPFDNNLSALSIGGTATSLSAIDNCVYPYDRNVVHLSLLKTERLYNLRNKLFAMTEEQRENIKEIQKGRGKIIACGCAILHAIAVMLNLCEIIVSESDNLEGYLALYTENL
ncbi:MAG: rod shape-determining protein [Clostridia bacterium]|nr:rod shape-determining protein [Clostridia bacterium]